MRLFFCVVVSFSICIKPNSQILRYKIGFHDKMLDTVGVDGRYQERLIDDILRRSYEPPLEFPEEQLPSFPIVGKWSKLSDLSEEETTAISSATDSISQLKARQNQIRVTNINAELAAIEEKAEARSRRLAEIKGLLAENDALSSMAHAAHERNLAHQFKNQEIDALSRFSQASHGRNLAHQFKNQEIDALSSLSHAAHERNLGHTYKIQEVDTLSRHSHATHGGNLAHEFKSIAF